MSIIEYIRRLTHLNSVNDPDSTGIVDSGNITSVEPALRINGFLRVLLI
jgi:hypothetical protein